MKHLFQYTYVAVLAAIMAVFASCTKEFDYEAATAEGQQVYFPNTIPSTVAISKDADFFEVPVMRVNTADAISIPVTVTLQDGSKYTCENATAVFAAGSNKTTLKFKFDPSKMEFDEFETITLSIGGEGYTNEWGDSKITFKAGVAMTWSLIGEASVNIGFWGITDYAVDFYRCDIDKNLYRIENPIAKALAEEKAPVSADASKFLTFRVLKPGDIVAEQEVTSEGLVYFYGDTEGADFNSGEFVEDYEADILALHPSEFKSLADQSNWTHNCVTVTQEDGTPGVIQLAPFYYMNGVGGWNNSGKDGEFTIVYPGFEVVDYSATVDVVGRLIDTKGKGKAVFNVELGANVASAAVAMAPGKDAGAEAYQLILDEDPSVVSIESSQEVRIPYTEPGDYTVVVVTYNEEFERMGTFTTNINIPSNGEPTEVFTAIFTGIYTHNADAFDYNPDGEPMWGGYEPEDGMLYVSNLDDTKYMISPWVNLGYEEDGTEGEGLVFYMNEESDELSVPQCFSGVVDPSDGDIWAWDLAQAEIDDEYPCYYDDETGVFNFFLAWSCAAVDFAATYDTFELTGLAEAKAGKKAASKLGVKRVVPKHSLLPNATKTRKPLTLNRALRLKTFKK